MRQDDVMRILRASSEPMTVVDIVEAHGVRPNFTTTDRATVNTALRHLESLGLVRRAGYRKSGSTKGSPFVLWEATA